MIFQTGSKWTLDHTWDALNPIENLWSKVKQGLKSCGPRTARQLFNAAKAAFATVTPADCQGFFLHAGYAT